MYYGEEVKEISLKHVQGKAARDTLSAIIEWTGNKINTAKKRWVFELLQNAIDTATERKNENLKIAIEKSDHTLVFKHNAGWFKQEEIAAVFYGGSTKPFERESEYLGRFGTGFLVSHVLSRSVAVKAFFIDNQQNILTCHPISIDRTGHNEKDISDAIDTCFVQLNKAEITKPQGEYWSEFTYHITDETGQSAADDGIEILQKCLTLIFAFNYRVKSITINSVLYTPEYSKTGAIEAFKVNDTTFYFLKDSGVYVGILSKNNEVCLLDGLPRIFLDMPLVETADFIKSPFIINSRQLAPTERRDALDNNQKINEEILIAVPKLYKTFLNHLITSHDLQGKYNCLRIAEIPQNFQEQNPLWRVFNSHLKEEFEKILDETAIVQTTQGLLPFNKVHFPSNPDGIINDDLLKKFFNLASQIKSNIPSPENNTRWLELVEQLKELFSINQRIYNVHSLKNDICTFIVGKDSFPKLEKIGENLEIEDPRKFLFQLYEYVDNLYEKGNIHSDFCENLLLDQSGIIGSIKGDTWKIHLENEHERIDEDLKDIVIDIGWEIRKDLLDNEFTRFKIIRDFVRDKLSLVQITQTIQSPTYKLKDRIERWDEKSIGWIRLFWWYISKSMSLPDDFPIITKNKEVESIERKYLIPLELMNIDERFEDIFPEKRILSKKYFEQPAMDSLEKLNQHNHIITSLPSYTHSATIKPEKLRSIIEASRFESSLIDHRLECKTPLISEMPFWGELIGKISDDINRAKLFFCFIFEYLAEKDKSWNLKTRVNCICSEGVHNILPSTWLAGLKTDKWVPVKIVTENDTEDIERRQASKESIERLFSTEEFETLLSNKRATALALLPHLGFDGLDLKIKIQSIETGKPEQILRNEVRVLADINQRFPDLANLAADDPQGVENALRELKEQRKKEQLNNENKKIGENVELIVRQIVRRHGLQVKNIHKGADMEIWFECENDQNWSSGVIEVDIDNTRFYLESKFTSTDSVHISPAQSESARKYKERYVVFIVKNIAGLRDDLKVDMQEGQENVILQNIIIENSSLIQNIFTKLGEEPNINEVEIDLNGYWIKQALWSNADTILDWLKKVTFNNLKSNENFR